MVANRAVSIFDQVNTILRNKITRGEFVPGTRLPSESALAKELGVSRATIRMVLGKLETEGIVSRRHGDGTYVNKHVLGVDLKPTRKMAFRYMIEERGHTAEVVRLSVDVRPPTKDEAERLELLKKEEVFHLIVLFLADKQPAIYSNNVYPYKMFTARMNDFDTLLSMDEFVECYTGEQIAYSVSDIIAASAPETVARQFKINLDEPILKSFDMFYNLHDKPLVFGTNYYHQEAFRLRIAQPW